MKEHGNGEMFETCELSNKVQCEHCGKYVLSGHVCCGCGRAVVYTDPNRVIVDQIQRNIKQQFELLATLTFLLLNGPNRGRKWCTSADQQQRGAAHSAFHKLRRKGHVRQMDKSRSAQRISTRNLMDRRRSISLGYIGFQCSHAHTIASRSKGKDTSTSTS